MQGLQFTNMHFGSYNFRHSVRMGRFVKASRDELRQTALARLVLALLVLASVTVPTQGRDFGKWQPRLAS